MSTSRSRLRNVEQMRLSRGVHRNLESGASVMELSSYLAGELWSNYPECVSSIISAFLCKYNDLMDDAARQLLLPYASRVIGSAGSREVEQRRVFVARDWLVRVWASSWLRTFGLAEHADRLASLPKITEIAQVEVILGVLHPACAALDEVIHGEWKNHSAHLGAADYKTASEQAAWAECASAVWSAMHTAADLSFLAEDSNKLWIRICSGLSDRILKTVWMALKNKTWIVILRSPSVVEEAITSARMSVPEYDPIWNTAFDRAYAVLHPATLPFEAGIPALLDRMLTVQNVRCAANVRP